jgi:polysaccharide export outer membrane protein
MFTISRQFHSRFAPSTRIPFIPESIVSPIHDCDSRTLTAAAAPTPKASRRLLPLGLALAIVGGLVGCKSPGMKLEARPDTKERSENMNGMQVTLRALTPQVVQAQAGPMPAPEDLDGLVSTAPKPYRVGPQDILLVTVWEHPEIAVAAGPYRTDSTSGTVVEENGEIYFPYCGKVHVAGMTTGEVRDVVTARLGRVFRNPQVDVKMIAFRSQKVYVGGEVRNPAVYPVTDVPFTLAQAVNYAGGILPTGDDTRFRLNRGNRSWVLNFPAIMASGGQAGQILLQDGDSLQVPNVNEEPVYMMGELFKPGTQPLLHGSLSLARAISEAGGLSNTTADATSVYVIRPGTVANAVTVYHLDARNPASMVLADKFALNPHDIVYVDAGSLVRFSRVMNLLMPTISAVTQGAQLATQYYYFRKNY